MSILYSEFKRKFSFSMYKNLKINLSEMSFAKDFVNDTCGDLYPVAYRSDDCMEAVVNNQYVLNRGSVKRLVCAFFPYASIIPVNMGSRTRYFRLTFDRHKGSDYNWSYGNIYCFEA